MNRPYFDLTPAADALSKLPAESAKSESPRVMLDGGIVIYLDEPSLVDWSGGGMGVDFQWLADL